MAKRILKYLPSGESYHQSPRDNSCGPLVMLYVADYILRGNSQKLTAIKWIEGVRVIRGDNIWSDSLTRKNDLIEGIRHLGLKSKEVSGKEYMGRIESMERSITKGNPVIISCLVKPYRNKNPFSHYAVVVGFDRRGVYVHDPYPQKKGPNPYHIPNEIFESKVAIHNKTVWGRSRWGIEVTD